MLFVGAFPAILEHAQVLLSTTVTILPLPMQHNSFFPMSYTYKGLCLWTLHSASHKKRVSSGEELCEAAAHFSGLFIGKAAAYETQIPLLSKYPAQKPVTAWLEVQQDQNQYSYRSRNLTTKLRPYTVIKLQNS